eukprot:7703918-Pyramimonas_sp.AAC.1
MAKFVCWVCQLAVLDSAGRQFAQNSYASKVAFLTPFAFFKVRFVAGQHHDVTPGDTLLSKSVL